MVSGERIKKCTRFMEGPIFSRGREEARVKVHLSGEKRGSQNCTKVERDNLCTGGHLAGRSRSWMKGGKKREGTDASTRKAACPEIPQLCTDSKL